MSKMSFRKWEVSELVISLIMLISFYYIISFCHMLMFVVVYNSQFSPHLLPHYHFMLAHWGLQRTLTTSYLRKFFVHRWNFLIRHQLVASSIGSRKMLKPLTVICLRPCGRSQHVYLGYFLGLLHGAGSIHIKKNEVNGCLFMRAKMCRLQMTCWRDWFHNIFPPFPHQLHYISCLRSEEISFRKRCINEHYSSDSRLDLN